MVGTLDERVEEIFGGITRNSLPSTLNLGPLLYYVLDPLWAHVANELLTRTVGLLGMLLLLRRHVLPEGDPRVALGVSLCFALYPYMPAAYLSILGLPLLLHALLELRAGRGGIGSWAVVVLFPLYSSFVYVGFFVLLLLGLWALVVLVRERRIPVSLVAAGAVVGALYVASEYRVFYQALLDDSHVSHRSQFVRHQGGWKHVLRATARAFFAHHRHAPSLQTPVVLLTVGVALGWGLRDLRRRAGALRPRALWAALRSTGPAVRLATLVLLAALCVGSALVVGLWNWSVTQALIETDLLRVVRPFNFQRVLWFQPVLFSLAFAVALYEIGRRGPRARAAAAALLGAQLLLAALSVNELAERRETGLTWREYYSPALFAEVREHIGLPTDSYRVASFGMTPAIPLYNGFQVVDGFVNDYPLEYKRRFRRVIARELDKDPFLARHFDNWGGHVDLLSSELGRVSGYGKTLYTRDAERRAVSGLELDARALRALGADYVLSAVEIRNHEALGLRSEGVFTREDSPWRIEVYAVPE